MYCWQSSGKYRIKGVVRPLRTLPRHSLRLNTAPAPRTQGKPPPFNKVTSVTQTMYSLLIINASCRQDKVKTAAHQIDPERAVALALGLSYTEAVKDDSSAPRPGGRLNVRTSNALLALYKYNFNDLWPILQSHECKVVKVAFHKTNVGLTLVRRVMSRSPFSFDRLVLYDRICCTRRRRRSD